ncbi:short transient receptor potential channel 4-associated protein-like isoform X2 [Actinia tenebrosa]|uniref:Short transient receptor potential channel 4-associated protein-like isoform X2 n=1 Tax=Actinia tenebrosa TaxID=6105 RepID=A0A6P8I0U2_ACTTE|nr:short transient receptor potential channel 4-associated protein-like isoform X2 [Actinia tenebrosa]
MAFSSNSNMTFLVLRSQTNGSKLNVAQLPKDFLRSVDRRLGTEGIPQLLRQLRKHVYHSDEKFNMDMCVKNLIEIRETLEAENQTSPDFPLLSESPLTTKNYKNKVQVGKVITLFGGVETLVELLFIPTKLQHKPKRLTRIAASMRASQMNDIVVYSLEILHMLCLTVEGVAVSLAKKTELLDHLFTLLSNQKVFMNATAVLEDLLAAKKGLIDLECLGNLRQLISNLDSSKLANFCRVLSFTLTDLEAVEDRSTLLAQDEQDKEGSTQKDLADQNQGTLISFPEFLPRLVKLACKSLKSPVWPTIFGNNSEGLMEWLGFQTILEDVLINMDDSTAAEETSIPSITTSLKLMHEVMHKVEVFYVLCLFLTGKHKPAVQERLSELHLIPGMSDLFDHIVWLRNTPTRRELLDMDGEQDCTPENALKIQFLRLVHSFCDRHENKHLLMTAAELDELEDLYRQNDVEIPSGVQNINRKLCCQGDRGLLSKILEVLIKTPPTAAIRFWLSRAIEGFLRGRASFGNQLFLIKRGLLKHLVEHIGSSEMKPKEILQSSFDLLGELMKFNPIAFKIFNSVIDDKQFEKFTHILTSNVVDSNMLIRCLILSQERFMEEMPFGDCATGLCRLGTLITDWDQRMYLLNKLINSITVNTLTQENVSCLNTTLVFLMIAFKQGHLPAYLKAFVREERLQKNPGFILKNLRRLLEFWKTHYLKRGKDCSALEQSSCISFDQWKKVVDILLQDNIESTSSVLYYLSPHASPPARHC